MRLSVALLVLSFMQDVVAFRVVCVYTNWAQYRPDGGKFLPEDVDPAMCTHLIYVYAKLNRNKIAAVEWNDVGNAWSEGMYDRANNLKKSNPDMKTLLGIGGWNMGSKDFSRMAAGRINRRVFVRSVVKFLRGKKFDGLTIDWQHPTKRGGRPRDRINFSLLLKELRKAFDDDSKKTGLPSLLLTAGVSASQRIIEDAYEVDNITKYTDFINVFAYDLHGAWENFTGHPSQLYARDDETGPLAELNVDVSMRYWMSHVPDRSKLVLGISTSARTFTLADSMSHGVYSMSDGPGLAGDFTLQAGMLAYYERCFQYADATRVWDDASKSAYWYSGDQWIAGEDEESVKAKVHWTRYNNIGGIMLSSLDMDDSSGLFCTGDIYPLLITIHEQLVAHLPPNPYKGRKINGKQPTQVEHSYNSINVTPPSTFTPQTTYPTTTSTDMASTETQTYPTTIIYISETTTDDTPYFNETDLLQGDVKPWSEASELVDQQISLQSQHPEAAQNQVSANQVSANIFGAADQYSAQNTSRLSVNESNRLQTTEIPLVTEGIKTKDESNAFGEKVQSIASSRETYNQKIDLPNRTIPLNASDISANNEPLQETQIRTFLNNAANLPTHRLINGILKILSHNEQVTEPSHIATTLPPTTTTTKRPKSRVHAVLPISILRSFKGSVSLFGGADVLEKRPIRQDVSNIWDDPYAQQFLRDSKTFTSKRNNPSKSPSSKP